MCDVEAERDLLAAMLSDGAARDEALPPAVYASDLVGIGHTEIFASIVGLHTAGDEVDAHSVAEILRVRCHSLEAARPGYTGGALGVLDDLPHGGGAERLYVSIQWIATCAELRDLAAAAAPEAATTTLQRSRRCLLAGRRAGTLTASELVDVGWAELDWRYEHPLPRT